MSKHTPGPWKIKSISQETGSIGVGSEEHRILIADVTNAASLGDMLAGAMRRGGGSFSSNDCETQFANARLIAAAPDLLHFVKKVRVYARETDDESLYAAADEIIAKAEGRHANSAMFASEEPTKIAFGLEAQGHIQTVEAALAEGADWQEIGQRINWDGETAKSYYERYLARKGGAA